MKKLPRQGNPNVLVGFDTNDDAGVYRMNENLAVVQTVDFFTPIVDKPQHFGEIAAANALSDVYAMGGDPISALSIVAFPEHGDLVMLEEILRGGLTKMAEANCVVIGGHSIRSDEILFGYAVTGLIDPRRIWRNVGARTGDVLLLTKPLGTGVITAALKSGIASAESLEAAVTSMTKLNRGAAAALRELEEGAKDAHPIHAVTDVTGFGLLGHAREMALGSPDEETSGGITARVKTSTPPVSFEFDHSAFAYLPGATQAAREGHLSGGLKNNRAFVGDCVEFAASVAPEIPRLAFRSADFGRITDCGGRAIRRHSTRQFAAAWNFRAHGGPRYGKTVIAIVRAVEMRTSAAAKVQLQVAQKLMKHAESTLAAQHTAK